MTKQDNAYEAIGKYIIAFQEIPFILQGYITSILNKEYGLKKDFGDFKKENIVARILLGERSVDHLLKIFLSLVGEIFGKTSEDFKTTKKIIDFIFNEVLPHRNDLVHSFLVVDQEDIENIIMCREKFKSKSGFGLLQDIPVDHLEKQIKTIKEICAILHSIGKNIEQNGKVCGKFKYGRIQVDISLEGVNKGIEKLKRIDLPK